MYMLALNENILFKLYKKYNILMFFQRIKIQMNVFV